MLREEAGVLTDAAVGAGMSIDAPVLTGAIVSTEAMVLTDAMVAAGWLVMVGFSLSDWTKFYTPFVEKKSYSHRFFNNRFLHL